MTSGGPGSTKVSVRRAVKEHTDDNKAALKVWHQTWQLTQKHLDIHRWFSRQASLPADWCVPNWLKCYTDWMGNKSKRNRRLDLVCFNWAVNQPVSHTNSPGLFQTHHIYFSSSLPPPPPSALPTCSLQRMLTVFLRASHCIKTTQNKRENFQPLSSTSHVFQLRHSRVLRQEGKVALLYQSSG